MIEAATKIATTLAVNSSLIKYYNEKKKQQQINKQTYSFII